uniref:Uncharacterized protein n=1 Tax=Helianthus annuus TaxID=4232 RepID=A0A251VJG2_HELAN
MQFVDRIKVGLHWFTMKKRCLLRSAGRWTCSWLKYLGCDQILLWAVTYRAGLLVGYFFISYLLSNPFSVQRKSQDDVE